MKKSLWGNLILLGGLAFLVAWYWGYEKHYKLKKESELAKQKLLVPLELDTIQYFSLIKPVDSKSKATLQKRIDFKKIGESWHITHPVEALANTSAVDSTLRALTKTPYLRKLPFNPEQLDTFGLSPQKATLLTVKQNSQSPEIVLHIGHSTELEPTCYVQKEQEIFIASNSLKKVTSRAVDDFRERNVFDWQRGSITEVTLSPRSKPSFTLKKRALRDWILASQDLPAQQNAVDKTLNALVALSATGFPSETDRELRKYGLQHPALTVELKQESGTSLQLLFGKVKEKIYVKRNDRANVMEVGLKAYESIGLDSQSYMDRRLVAFDRFKLQKVRFASSQMNWEMVKEGGQWKAPKEPEWELDPTIIETYLVNLQETMVEKFLDSPTPQMGLENPQAVLTLWQSQDSTPPIEIKFGQGHLKHLFGIRSGLSKPFMVLRGDFDALKRPLQTFKKKKKAPPKSPPPQKQNKK